MPAGSAWVCVDFIAFVCVCLCVCLSQPWVVDRHARAARAAASTQATSLLTWWSSSQSARGGGRPQLHSLEQQSLCWNIDVMAAHAVFPGPCTYQTCVTRTVNLFSQPCCSSRGEADILILKITKCSVLAGSLIWILAQWEMLMATFHCFDKTKCGWRSNCWFKSILDICWCFDIQHFRTWGFFSLTQT